MSISAPTSAPTDRLEFALLRILVAVWACRRVAAQLSTCEAFPRRCCGLLSISAPTSAPTDRFEFAQPGLHVRQLELAQPGLYVGQLGGLHVGQLSFAVCAVRELKKGEVRKKERKFRAHNHRFFRVDESFRASTRAGLTCARSLNTWVYSERNAVTHLPVYSPYGVSCNPKVTFEKIKRKKRKLSRERLLSEKTPRFLF